MTKLSIENSSWPAGWGHPCLDDRRAFVGDGVALLTKDIFGDFAPLPWWELETILSAGYGIAVDLASRMYGLATLAKALNQGDHAERNKSQRADAFTQHDETDECVFAHAMALHFLYYNFARGDARNGR